MAHPPKRRRTTPHKSPPAREAILTIDGIGHRGDGVARLDGRPVFVPNTLPGESVCASVAGERGTVLGVLQASPERATPFCPHFGICGGCTSQHMTTTSYSAWKRGIVEIALKNRGIELAPDPLIDAHGQGRRRATLHAQKAGSVWVVGFSEARSHRIFNLDRCPILAADLHRAPDIVRALAHTLPKASRFDAHVTLTDSGLDLHLVGIDALTLETRTAMANEAERLDLARIAVDDEAVSVRRQPRVQMGLAAVAVPPGGFLQATAAGERILAEQVCKHLSGVPRVADLFAGLGPFALRLAEAASVEAIDSDPSLTAALSRAARYATKLRPIKVETRDLFMRPLQPAELDRFDGIVFDPPRAGAEAQARILAASRVSTIVAVSCDPASLARDAALLIAGGYKLERVTPIDQFKWSPHVEIVALFRR